MASWRTSVRHLADVASAARVIMVCILLAASGGSAAEPAVGEALSGTITMSGAWALYPMAVKWAEEFQKIHNGVRIDVAAGGAGKGMADALAEIVDIGMISRDIHSAEVANGAWWISVAEDAVVPVINERNPVLELLGRRGVTRQTLERVWISGSATTWGDLVGSESGHPVRVYTRSDACGAADTWARYLGGTQEDLLGIGVYGDPGLAQAVQHDALGIGFNNINYAYDATTGRAVRGLRILPIDLDGNGRIDDEEDVFNSRDDVVEAIARGAYPSPPARNLHFASKGRPDSPLVLEFMRWVLTEGQLYVSDAGYIRLSDERLAAELLKLRNP